MYPQILLTRPKKDKTATCNKIWENLRDNAGCKRAREDLANKCFIGREDEGHRQAREDAGKALETCKEKKTQCGCKYWLKPY